MAAASTVALLAISAASAAGTAIGQRKQARLIEQQGDYEAMLFGRNAASAERQAADALARGREVEMDVNRDERLLRGGQRAAFAAQGLSLDSGSARDVQTNDATLAEADRRRIRTNAAREALGFTEQAEDYRLQGDWARQSAKSQARALRNQSVVTLLTGAADMARVYQSGPKRIKGGAPASRTAGRVSTADARRYSGGS